MPPNAMYNSTIWYLSNAADLLLKNSSHSLNVNGSSFILCVIRLCSPPLLFISLLIIQAAADPQTISKMSFLALAQEFQKCSNAGIKVECGVSSQGSSSRNIIFLALLF